jgi:hypothetical protein
MPDFIFDTLDQVPEELHSDAVKREDGKVVLNLVPKKKIDEFREKNIAQAKDLETFASKIAKLSKYVGEDEDKFINELEDLRTTKQKVLDGKLSESSQIEDVLSERTKKMRETYEEEIRGSKVVYKDLEGKFDEVVNQLKNTRIDSYIQNAINDPKSGARTEAASHILLEARKVFKIEGDKIIPKDEGGLTVYGSDGTSPMSPVEWLKGLQKTLPYLFKESNGGGASGGGLSGYGNMTKADVAALSPRERLALANKAKQH